MGQAAPPRVPSVRSVAIALAVLLAYVLAGKVGLSFAFLHVSASPIWPPAGLAVAALLLFGPRLWPAIFAGAFVVNVTTAGSVATSLAIAAGNTLEALLAAELIRRFAGGVAAFDRATDIFAFAGLGLISSLVSPSLGLTALALSGYAPWSGYERIWLTWWLGDAAGIVMVAPLWLLWARDPPLARLRSRPLEALLLLGATVGVAVFIFAGIFTPALAMTFACSGPLLWAALRFGRAEVSVGLIVIAAVAVRSTVHGLGVFAWLDANQALLMLQLFMGTIAIIMLPVATLVWERERADEATRLREEQLRVALDAARMGTWEWTVGTDQVRWSAGLELIHGLEPGTFAGTYQAFLADVHPEDRALVERTIREALAGGQHHVEYRIVRPDGSVRWVEGRGDVSRDARGRPVRMLGVCADVTARKMGEAERLDLLAQEQGARRRAEEAERRVAFLGEIARSITSSLDLDTVLQRIADGARALCHGDTAAIFLREEGSAAMVPRYRVGPWLAAYETLRLAPGEGLGGIVMQSGRPVRTLDYRADDRAPEHLHPLSKATGTVALMVVPIIIGTEVTGLLYISNRTARELTDEDEAVCVGLAEAAAVAIQNARSFAREEDARAAAEAANREKDAFLAMLSHELRNPLGAIGNSAQILELGPGEADAAAARAVISRQVEHLSRLVDDLLDVSRALSGTVALERRPLDLAELAGRVAATLAGVGGTGRPALTFEAEPIWIDGDPMRIEQLVANLIGNALKYTPEEGTVKVRVAREGEHAVLAVADTGMGIPPELLPRVFDLFVQGDHTLDRRGAGLGIGLTLVRRIAEMHGGSVEARSDGPGRGSCFTARFPAVPAPPAPAPAGPPVRAAGRPGRRVLVVEDNDDAREMLCRLLRLLGHESHAAADGPAGVARALELQPDVTLIDIGLPGLDGYEVVKQIRAAAAGKDLRLVALTGYGMPEDSARALAAGYDLHLVKPIDPERLAELLS